MTDRKDLDIELGNLPEVGLYGVPGYIVAARGDSEDGELDWEYALDEASEYEENVIKEGIKEQSEERARAYLSKHGDVISRRVEWCLAEGERLLPEHPAASLTVCLTAAELIIRFLLLRPLLGGLIFNDEIAERLAYQASPGQSGRDREVLPIVNAAWDLWLERLKLEDGTPVWEQLNALWKLRNGFVHRGTAEGIEPQHATSALLCTRELLSGLVEPLAARLHMTWPEDVWLQAFDQPQDPFERQRDRRSAKPPDE